MNFADFGMDFANPDFVCCAQAYGAHGNRPQSVADFADLLVATARMPGVHLIDLAIDYSDNDLILNQELKAISAQV